MQFICIITLMQRGEHGYAQRGTQTGIRYTCFFIFKTKNEVQLAGGGWWCWRMDGSWSSKLVLGA